MPNTTPDNIYYPDSATQVAPLESIFATNATSIQNALNTQRAVTGSTGATPGVIPAGTTAQRDAFWGAPASAAARVALANKGARWYNTEKGYEQQYFAQFDDAGAGVNTPSKAVFGWAASSSLGVVPLRMNAATTAATGGGTAVRRGSKVFFTAATAVQVNSIFTTDFDKYLIALRITGATVVSDIYMRTRRAGVEQATGYKRNRMYLTEGNVTGSEAPGSAADIAIGATGAVANGAALIEISVDRPAISTQPTLVLSHSYDARNLQMWGGGTGETNTHDGFSIFQNGLITGELTVFGVNGY